MSANGRSGVAGARPGSSAAKAFDLTVDDEDDDGLPRSDDAASAAAAKGNGGAAPPADLSEAEKLAVQALSRPQDVEPYKKLIVAALKFMQSLAATSARASTTAQHDAKGPALPEHAFCRLCPGGEHPELHAAMIRVFSFKEQPPIIEWKRMIFDSISRCKDCFVSYSRAKDELRARFSKDYPRKTIEDLFVHIHEKEEDKVLEVLQERQVLTEPDLARLSSAESFFLGHALAYPGSSRLQKVIQSLSERSRRGPSSRPPVFDEVVPGLLTSLTSEAELVRQWAMHQLDSLSDAFSHRITSQYSTIARTVLAELEHDACSRERRELLWTASQHILKHVPKATTAYVPLVVNRLGDQCGHFESVLSCFHICLDRLGSTFWKQDACSAEDFPSVLLALILDNPRLVDLLDMDARTHGDDCSSPGPSSCILIYALSFTEDGAEALFTHATKTVANFLLEKMQQGHFGLRLRSRCLALGIKALSAALNDGIKRSNEVSVSGTFAAAGMYADTLVGISLHGTFPHSKERTSTASQLCEGGRVLLQQILLVDARMIRSALFKLSLHVQYHQSNFRKAFKDVKGQATMSDASAGDKVITAAASEKLVSPNACKAIWHACYRALSADGCQQALDVVLAPLTILSDLTAPSPRCYMIMRTDARSIPKLHQYLVSLRTCIASIQTALADVRDGFPIALEDFFSMLSEERITSLCVLHAEHLMMLNLSPERTLHLAAQNMIKTAFYAATVRADCFRVLLTSNPAASLRGLNASLDSFLETAQRTIEASTLAEWTVKSLGDLLDVFCSMRDGLLRPGTNDSLLSSASSAKHVVEQVPHLWKAINEVLAQIFERTPRWANVIDAEDLTAWFRDVTILSIEVVENLRVVSDALAHAATVNDRQSQTISQKLTLDIARPLEKSLSWLRMNNAEMLHDTRNFVVKALGCFNQTVPLPDAIRERFLRFVDGQMKIKDVDARQTLLTTSELAELKYQIDPSLAPVDISSDESEPGSDEEIVGYLAASATDPAPAKNKLPPPKPAAERKKLQQRTLDFSNAKPKRASPPAPAASSINRFKAAGTEKHAPAQWSSEGMSRMSALRSEHRPSAAPVKKPINRRAVAPASTGPAWEVPEKRMQATSAVPFAASALQGQQQKAAASESDTDSSSDDEAEARGLAALKARSPLKKLKQPRKGEAKTRFLPDDDRLQATMRDQEELERRRRLRAPADLTALHQSILSWPYDANDELPPQDAEPREVAKTFSDPQEYITTFAPLLLLECWAQFQSAKEEFQQNRAALVEVASRVNVDSFIDLNVVFVEKTVQGQRELSEVDVVFLRESGLPGQAARTVLAKVQGFRRNPMGNQATLRLNLQNDKQGLSSALTTKSRWVIGQLFSLATIHRECAALLTAPYLDLRQQIFSGQIAPRADVSSADAQRVMTMYDLNEPQAKAVVGSLSRNGISLIQGPPGTGKTKTICGLVGRFLTERGQRSDAPNANPRNAVASGPKAKILVCAPSNAAIDEVAKRLKDGLPSADGSLVRPKVIRIGRDEAMNVEVKDISLDFLLDQAVAGAGASVNDTNTLQEEIRQLQLQRQEKQAALEQARKARDTVLATSIQAAIRLLMSRRTTAMSKLDEIKDKAKSEGRQRDAERRKLRNQILLDADIICCTLSGAGHESLASLSIDFETVIIDEAAQAVELSTLIPMRYGCRKCIMVGDPNQLAPTVLSRPADSKGYSQSLFVRLFRPDLVYLLSIQYRMHPSISKFPSTAFYQGNLADGPDMDIKTKQPWHSDALLAPFQFFDVRGKESKGRFHSLQNMAETEIAIAIYEKLTKVCPREDFAYRIGVISMYKAQVEALRSAFKGRYGTMVASRIDFNTVDGFQGQEKDIIILSCVRAGQGATVGFLSDTRRLNVAITRARCSLFVIGDSSVLNRHSVWAQMITMSKQNESFEANTTVATFQKASVQKAPRKLPSPAKPTSTVQMLPPPNKNADKAPVPKQGAETSSPKKRPAGGAGPSKPAAGANGTVPKVVITKQPVKAKARPAAADDEEDLIPLAKKPRQDVPASASALTSAPARSAAPARPALALPGSKPAAQPPGAVRVDPRARSALFVPKARVPKRP